MYTGYVLLYGILQKGSDSIARGSRTFAQFVICKPLKHLVTYVRTLKLCRAVHVATYINSSQALATCE